MPPKRRRKPATAASQEDNIQAVFRKLSAHLDKVKGTTGTIALPPALLKDINGVISACRAKQMLIDQPVIDDFVKMLNDDDGNLYSRLNAEAFSAMVKIILQIEACKEAERGLHLLAASLFHDAQDPEEHEELDQKKDIIGTHCLVPLLNYFVDPGSDFGMRRWAGLLCIQLIMDCDSNHSKLESAPEDSRRGVGRQVFEESDEILKVIYAQLVRLMVEKDTPLDAMFPQHYDEDVYARFPTSSQATAGWVVQFQQYVDDVLNTSSIKAAEDMGYLFFATKIMLTPGDQLGPRHHNAVMFMDGAQLSFLARSRDGHFDTVLDVPLSLIKKMTFVSDNTSQIDSLRITLDLREYNMAHDESPCFLDAKALQLSMVAFSMVSESIENFRSVIYEVQGDIEISQPENGSLAYTQPTNRSGVDLGESQARTQETRRQLQDLGSSNELSGDQGSRRQIQELGNSNELSQSQASVSQADLEARVNSQHDHEDGQDSKIEREVDEDDEDLYSASPQKTQAKELSPEVESSVSVSKPAITRGRKGVKPKAKPPIVPGRHSLDSQMAMAKPNSQIANPKAPKDNKGNSQSKSLTQAKTTTNAAVKKTIGTASAMIAEKKNTNAKAQTKTVPVVKKRVLSATKPQKPAVAKKVAIPGVASSKTAVEMRTTNPEYDFPDNHITSPDVNDASTPKVSKSKSTAKPPKAITKPSGSQTKTRVAIMDHSPAPVRKRYGLPKPTDNASNGKDEKVVEVRGKVTKSLAKEKSKAEPKATKPTVSTKADAKKRQSAPAALQVTRQSQRAAASKAKDKMQGTDDNDDDDELENLSPITVKLKAVEDKQTTATVIPTELSEKDAAEFKLQCSDKVKDVFELQAEDARSLGLSLDKSPVVQQIQSSYGVSPVMVTKNGNQVSGVPKTAKPSPKPPAHISAIDMASKLSQNLGCLDSETEQDQPQLANPRNSNGLDVQHEGSQPAQNATEEDDQAGVSERQENEEYLHQKSPLSEHDSTPSALNFDTSVVPYPPALLPDDPDTPYPEAAVVQDEESSEVPSPPVIQETVETQLKTQITTEVLKVSKLKLPARASDTFQTLLNNEEIIVEDQIVASEEVRQVDVVNVSKKRKPTSEMLVPIKRRRAGEDTEIHEEDPQIILPAKAAVSKTTTRASRKSKTSSASPIRKSPRLALKATKQQSELKKADPELSAVSKDPSRKPQIINFGGQGPRNQGVASAAKSKNRSSAVEAHEEASPAETQVADRKRKREKANLAEAASPPKKKQNSSPVFVESNDHLASEPNSSPPLRAVKSKQGRQRLASRPSSQTSRVDRNGSPIAGESPIDHFGKLKERLADADVQGVPQISKATAEALTAVFEGEITRPRRASQIFGPKISLGGKLKARPSSPNEPNSRYIAHGEAQGVYTDVGTKEVVEEKKILPDPFIERNRKSSGFIERLQDSATKGNTRAKNALGQRRNSQETHMTRGHRAAPIRSNENEELPELARPKPAPNHGQRKIGMAKQAERKTRASVYEQSSPSDMTSGTSYGSQSSDAVRSPLREVPAPNETWNLAVRPHYKTFGQAIHRIANELIIRLSSEEDKMDLLVDQYKENGTKLLDSLQKKRENEKGTLFRNLDQKKSDMAAVFGQSKNFIMETEESLREHSTSHFEREWRRKQSAIRKQISGSRKATEE